MSVSSSFNCVNYEDKSFGLKAADFILTPARVAFGGHEVRCWTAEGTEGVTFEVRQSLDRSLLDRIGQVVKRTLALVVAMVLSPVIVPAFLIKSLHSTDRAMQERIFQAEKGETKDRIKFAYSFSTFSLRVLNILLAAGLLDYRLEKKAGHLIGDSHLARSPELQTLQGGLYFQSAKMLMDDLSKCLDPKEDLDILQTVEQYLDSCKDFTPLIYTNASRLLFGDGLIHQAAKVLFRGDSTLSPLVEKTQKQIAQLQVGEHVFYPVNLKMNGFHTITAVIKRLPDGEDSKPCFQFIVNNVGAGVNNHPQCTISKEGSNQREYAAPFLLPKMTQEQVSDPEFLQDFILAATCKEEDFSADKLYSVLRGYALKHHLEVIDQRSPLSAELAIEKGRPLQESGTCILKSPLSALKYMMPYDRYKRMMFKYKLHNWFELNREDPRSTLYRIAADKLKKRVVKQAGLENMTADQVIDKYFSDKQKEAYSLLC
jgi:hypothetical protein